MIIPVSEAKRWLRRCLIRLRQSLPASERKRASRRAVAALLRSSLYRRSKTIAVFVSFGSEIETRLLVERAWADQKNVLLPITRHGFHSPHFALFRPDDSLAATRHGHHEHVKTTTPFHFGRIDLVVVPGLAFDDAGFRLGYGGGVYDRLLAQTPRAHHVGLFFSSQRLHRLPRNRHDHPMTAIVTERGVFVPRHERNRAVFPTGKRLAKRGK